MKSRYSTPIFFFRRPRLVFCFILFAMACTVQSQNLVVNSSFAGGSSVGWSTGSSIEINPQSVYGGTASTVYSTELDVERTISQKICILPGLTYTLSFQASRRTGGGTPANPGLQVMVTGVASGTNYVNNIQAYTNTTWSAQSNRFTVTVPSGSADKQVNIQFLSSNNSGTYGVIVWDIQMAPAATNSISVAGPSNVNLLNPAGFSVTNAPSSAAYNWSFPGANLSTSTNAAPSGISWSSLGTKTVSTALSNGTCTMASYSTTLSVVAILPVQWENFNGSIVNHNAHLSWVVQQESHGRYFIIQRSVNAVDFDSVAVVTSLNSNQNQAYSFTDRNTPTGHVYYRLVHVNGDGRIEYSSILSLSNNRVAVPGTTNIFPNPAVSTLTCAISSEDDSQAAIQIYTLTGILVMTAEFHLTIGVNRVILNISALRPGAYFFHSMSVTGGPGTVLPFVKG